MAMTLSNQTGDGIVETQIQTNIYLPDANGGNLTILGTVTPVGGPLVAITGSPIAYPSAPGSGSIYLILQVNSSTGAATLKQSTSAMPTPDSGNIQVFADTLTPSTTDFAQDPNAVTPDTI